MKTFFKWICVLFVLPFLFGCAGVPTKPTVITRVVIQKVNVPVIKFAIPPKQVIDCRASIPSAPLFKGLVINNIQYQALTKSGVKQLELYADGWSRCYWLWYSFYTKTKKG